MRILFIYLGIVFCSCVAEAMDYQEYLLLHNSNYCSNYFDHFEKKYKIPKHLLRSISIVETGRWHSGAKIYLPWPWAVNQGGKSYYFSSKQEAIIKVKQMLELGITNIDIGCMQINLHHHPDAFFNLNQAFEPRDNIDYAANFLVSNYKVSQNWQEAIAAYHSQAPVGKVYANKVLKMWSDYHDNKINHGYCTAQDGKVIPCEKTKKETLISVKPSDKSDVVLPNASIKKDPKRLKSAMIAYSINNELQ